MGIQVGKLDHTSLWVPWCIGASTLTTSESWDALRLPASMVDAEVPAAEAPEVVDGAVDGAVEITEGAAAKPDAPLKAPKRLPKPNKEEMVGQTTALHETIKARKARIEEINSIISGKKSQAEGPELVQLKKKMIGLRAQWDAELVSWRPVVCAHHTSVHQRSHTLHRFISQPMQQSWLHYIE